jgi:L-ribulose-5-phosphate 3-epimerase
MIRPSVLIAATPFCFGGFNPFVAYRHFAEAGLKYVEIPALPAGMAMRYDLSTFVPEVLNADDLRTLKQRLADLKLAPITVAAFCDLLEPGQADALRRRIDFAQELGAAYVITDATNRTDISPDARRKLLDSLRTLADYAGARNVRIALEIHEGPTRNGRLAAEFLDAVAHPNVGVNYDTGNIYYYNDDVDPVEDVACVADRVTHVHLKDTLGGKGEWKFCALGKGRVPFPPILSKLQSAGFEGPYSLEVEGIEGEDLNRRGYMDRLLESLAYLKHIGLVAP